MNRKREIEEDVVKVADLPSKARKLLEKKQRNEQKTQKKDEKERVERLEQMQSALQKILVQRQTSYAVELATGFGRGTLTRWASINTVDTVTKDISDMVIPQSGRVGVVVDEIVEKVKSDIALNDMLGKSAKKVMPMRPDFQCGQEF